MQRTKNKNKALKYSIGIVGLGMVGDALRNYFESNGYKRGKNLFCFDSDQKKKFTDSLQKAEIIFICVPTQPKKDGSCDISIVENTVKKYASFNNVLVIKSTVAPGTTEMLAKKYNTTILFNPEFLTEAHALENMIKPDRQIVGFVVGKKQNAKKILSLLPRAPFVSPDELHKEKFVDINATEAEVGKYAANLFGSLKVTFGNILADYCVVLENTLSKKDLSNRVDYNNIKHVLSHDARIGGAWLDVYHGNYRGYGGYCFPKDSNAFIASAKKILKDLNKSSATYKTLKSGIALFEAMRDYNSALLESQGLSVQDVSVHDAKLKDKLKSKNNKKQL